MHKNGVFHILFISKLLSEIEYDSKWSDNSLGFSNENMLIQQIINKTVIGGLDATVKDESMAGK